MRKVYWTSSGIVEWLVHESRLVNWMKATIDCKVAFDSVERVGSDKYWTVNKDIFNTLYKLKIW